MVINAFLIIVALILIGCTVLGGIKGFVHTIFTMFSLFIIIMLTGVLSPYVADYINGHTDVPKSIHSKVEEKINLKEKISSDSSANRNDLIDKMDMPEQLKEVIKEKSQAAGDAFSATTEAASEKLVTGIYDRITDLIVSAIAYLFTFAVVGVIVLIAGILLDIVSKLPGIKQANAILGVIVGFVQGYLAVSVVYIAAVAFAATELGASVISQVAESEILTWFYNHNIVVDIVFGMLK
ncbi:MAG: CvpA family protein [Lachnospiraceae bacterium]|jgi:uncharacterized membrane protein required for colicin V production|nr:CvpA family protein [Lachnospiraceae bacterium]